MSDFILINPIILKVFLYRNDYTDRQILTELKKMSAVYVDPKASGSFYIKRDEMSHVVRSVFSKELSIQRQLPIEKLSAVASSLYFLDSLIETYKRVKHFHVLVVDDEQFTRLDTDGEVMFEFKIDMSKIDLSTAIDANYLGYFKDAFKSIGVYDYTQPYYNRAPYFEIYTRDLVSKLDGLAAQFPENSDDHTNVKNILSFFTNKLQQDNSQLLIIMER